MSQAARSAALTGAGVVLFLLVLAELQCHEPGSVATIGSDARLVAFLACEVVAALVYFFAVWLIRRGPAPRHALLVVLAIAAATRIVAVSAPPFLSSDLFRYVWDGRVQAHGINPYRHIPAAPELAFLRDDAIYPSVNRSEEAPTIYPPMAQAIFAAVGLVWPSLAMVKLVMLGFEVVAAGTVVALLRRAGLPPAQVLIYAWNPLPVWEYAGNGHIDAASLGFIALALLAASSSRREMAGALLGLAILCKLLPAALVPAFWRRWDWRTLAALAVVIAGFYAVYAVGAGWRVLGYLPGYASEEGIADGSGFALLRFLHLLGPLPRWAVPVYLAAALLMLAALAAWFALGPSLPQEPGRRVLAIGRGATVLAFATTIAISPHYPWYLGWLSLLACLAPYRSVLYLSASGVLLYVDPYHRETAYPWLVYGPALALAVLDLARPPRMAPLGAG